jgi:uncharacterized Ntn-hydrolase superfamily protein
MRIATFSIVAADVARGEWGIAVASRFLAVGAVVPWARAGAGAVATQSYANTTFGPAGLDLMQQGVPAHEALERLLAADEGRAQRQVGMLDGAGRAATFTGAECFAWAGGRTGPGYACQGNLLTGPEVVERLAEAFEGTPGELAVRLFAALAAGDRAGGDSRGRQSAALLVVRHGGGYAGFNDRALDLRVDDAPNPIPRLRRLIELHQLYSGTSDPAERVEIRGAVARDLQTMMKRLGHYHRRVNGAYDSATREALRASTGKENLEDRVDLERGAIDPPALVYLVRTFGHARPAKRSSGASPRRRADRH